MRWAWRASRARHYATSKGVAQQVWVFPQDAATGERVFDLTGRRAFDFFSEQIGPYAYEKLAHVQAAGLGGGTEHATVIFYGEKGVAAGNAPVVHEVAHQWWGNAVTERDWDDVWLSEGFATYFTLLYTEHFDGRDAFVRGLRSSRERILQIEKKTPDTPVIHRNLSDMRRVLNQFVYQKGGWTLHMLRYQLGTERFWDGIREYYRRYQNQNASTDDLRLVMEQASGQDLSWFFAQWLTRSGVPALAGGWYFDASGEAARRGAHAGAVGRTLSTAARRWHLDAGRRRTESAAARADRSRRTLHIPGRRRAGRCHARSRHMDVDGDAGVHASRALIAGLLTGSRIARIVHGTRILRIVHGTRITVEARISRSFTGRGFLHGTRIAQIFSLLSRSWYGTAAAPKAWARRVTTGISTPSTSAAC